MSVECGPGPFRCNYAGCCPKHERQAFGIVVVTLVALVVFLWFVVFPWLSGAGGG